MQVVDVEFDRISAIGDEILGQVNRARAVSPILWNERLKAWIITGHRECVEALSGKLPLSNGRMHTRALSAIPVDEQPSVIPYLTKTLPAWVVNVDAPVHTRLRRLMMKAFTRAAAEEDREFTRNLVATLLGGLRSDQSIELVGQIGRPITARLILKILGLDEALISRMGAWSSALNGAFGGQLPDRAALLRAETTLLELRELFLSELRNRTEQPRDDFLSRLITARDGDDRLTEEEVLGICYIVLVAGHDTTLNTIALGTAGLARHEGSLDGILQHRDSMTNVVMEIMRYVSMSFSKVRAIAEDFNWHGHELRAGQHMFVTLAGANRDPAMFEEPERLDFSRPPNANMTFAPGMHHCIGHWIAKMELEEYFLALAERFDRIEVLDDRLAFGVPAGFRSLEHLNISLHGRNKAALGSAIR